ncbi:hypothetical protein CS369_14520 [Candidatus Symbiopectobacterium sp. 'North America']|nr:hypothetical protein [Candidatus Symbiopectobacterium sp. 'North America']
MKPLYLSYFKLQARWLHAFTRITYLSKLIGTHALAAFLQPELFRVYASGYSFFVSQMLRRSARPLANR